MQARSAGCRTFELEDDRTGLTVPLLVLYPTASPEVILRFGPYELAAAPDAPIAGGAFPLVVISHGTGGTGLVHRDSAAHLARNGFVVAMPDHPGNNRSDNRFAGTVTNLEIRPRHIGLIIDWAFDESPFAFSLKPRTAAIVGHSLGAYTALAVAGGVPTTCAHDEPIGEPRRIAVVTNARVKALVLLAPATAWFEPPDALRCVRIPILMLTAESDAHTPAWHAAIVRRGICEKQLVEHRTIANAGHFSFQSPFPRSMMNAGFLPAHDPLGFDRARFNVEMNADITAFLARSL